MNDDYKSLNGYGVVPSEILFNENEFFIQRQFYGLYLNIMLSVLLIFSSTASLTSAVGKELYDWFFYLQVIIVFLMLIVLVIAVYYLLIYRERNKKTYSYKDIKHFEANKKDVYINLLFELSDNSTDKIKLYSNTKSRDFITFLTAKVKR